MILLMEVHIKNIKNGKMKQNCQINTFKNNIIHSIQEIEKKKIKQLNGKKTVNENDKKNKTKCLIKI